VSIGRTYLFVVPWALTGNGGVDRVILNLYRQFEKARAHSPRILVASWEHVQPVTIDECGRRVTYMRIRSPLCPDSPAASVAKWGFFLGPELLRLARYLRAHEVECVNVHYPSLTAIQFILVRSLLLRSFRVVLSFHGRDVAQMLATTGLARRMWRLLLCNADALVSCSDALGESILQFEPGVRQRITTIHNGVDIEHEMRARDPAATIEPRLRGRPFVLSVATYERKKGLDTLLRAFHSLLASGAGDLMLALVGSDGDACGELRALAGQLGVSDHVVFCGEIPHSQIHAYYESASVFCLPSRDEPFGIAFLEAGAFRCPIVATSVGGIPEILTDGVNARLVPVDDPRELAAQLSNLLGDRRECDRLSGALFEHVRNRFSWEIADRAYARICGQA